MFDFSTRSSWRRCLNQAIDLVLGGKMTAEEFRAAARPSPDPRDPNPVTVMEARAEASRQAKEEARRLAAEAAARKATKAAKIDAWRDKKVWALSGFFLEDTTLELYTLTEIEEWARDYGYCLCGKDPCVSACLLAPGEDGNFCVNFSDYFQDCGLNLRPVKFARFATSLRETVARRR